MSWNAGHLHAALPQAQFRGDCRRVGGWRLDSREIGTGDGFLAFQGTQADGHDYVQAARDCGAVLAIVERFQDVDIAQIRVDSVQEALWQLAAYVRAHNTGCHYVGITGSVGKSSTRSLLDTALSLRARVYSSVGNLNNHLGMPLCLANMGLESDAGIGLFEIGMNHAGEIAPLSRLLRPQVALVLNVEAVHIENFADISGIARAKAEIYSGLDQDAHALIPAGPFAALMARGVRAHTHIILGEDSCYRWTNRGLYCRELDRHWTFRTRAHLSRFAANMLAVFEVAGILFGHDPEAITAMLRVLADWQPEAGRGQISTISITDGTITVIDDGYNASVPSMLATITQLRQTSATGRKILVLGDMKELGEYSAAAHAQVGRAVVEAMQQGEIDQLYTVGAGFMHCLADFQRDFPQHLSGWQQYPSAEQLASALWSALQQGDTVAIKGSFAMGLHRIPAQWRKEMRPE